MPTDDLESEFTYRGRRFLIWVFKGDDAVWRAQVGEVHDHAPLNILPKVGRRWTWGRASHAVLDAIKDITELVDLEHVEAAK